MSRIKVGRNDICPCGSGKKHKHCCLSRVGRPSVNPSEPRKAISLLEAVQVIRECAKEGRTRLITLGVFVLLADENGDAWLFEVTGGDADRLAAAGKVLQVEIDENSKTIEIDYQYGFVVDDGQVVLKGYEDDKQVILHGATCRELVKIFDQIQKKCTPELLERLHLGEQQVATSETS